MERMPKDTQCEVEVLGLSAGVGPLHYRSLTECILQNANTYNDDLIHLNL